MNRVDPTDSLAKDDSKHRARLGRQAERVVAGAMEARVD
jgi:hypothetical protein